MPEAEVLADLRWNPKNAANIFPSRCLGMFFLDGVQNTTDLRTTLPWC